MCVKLHRLSQILSSMVVIRLLLKSLLEEKETLTLQKVFLPTRLAIAVLFIISWVYL